MQQVKIFKGIESELAQLEQRINSFLQESNVRIIQMTGNIAPQSATEQSHALGKGYTPSDILVVILYERSE